MTLIAPSILSADFGHLARDIQAAEAAGAHWIHVDVMDGRFVPNLTIGPLVTAAVRRATRLPVDVHLMMEGPESTLSEFVRAGADRITVHLETCPHLHRTLQQIRELGALPGVALNPSTPVESLREVIPYLDLVLIMTVNPGFGGQAYIRTSTDKIRRARRLLDEMGRPEVLLQVDGGVDPATGPEVVEAGAQVLVAGSAVFGHPAGIGEGIRSILSAVAGTEMGESMREVAVLDQAQIARLKEWGGTDLQRKMIDLFLSHARERVEQIRKGLAEQDSRGAETGAHTLKSSAGNVGARRLQEMSADAELMAERGDLQALEELFPSIERVFEASCEALRIVMKELPE